MEVQCHSIKNIVMDNNNKVLKTCPHVGAASPMIIITYINLIFYIIKYITYNTVSTFT